MNSRSMKLQSACNEALGRPSISALPTLRFWLACSFLVIWLRLASGGNSGSRPLGPSDNSKHRPISLLARANDMWEAQQNQFLSTSQVALIHVWWTMGRPRRTKAAINDGRFVPPIWQELSQTGMASVDRGDSRPGPNQIRVVEQEATFWSDESPQRQFNSVMRTRVYPYSYFHLPELHGFDIKDALNAVERNWRRRIFFSQRLPDDFTIKIARRSSSGAYRPYRGKIVYAVIYGGAQVYIEPGDGPEFASIYALPHFDHMTTEYETQRKSALFKPPHWLARAESLASVQPQT